MGIGGDFPHLDIVGSRQGVSALKVEEVCSTANDTLLNSATAPEAKVMQPGWQQW